MIFPLVHAVFELGHFIDVNNTNSSQLLLSSTSWNGTVCAEMGIDNNTSMALPVANGSTFSNFTGYWNFNPQQIEFGFYGPYVANFTPANSSDFITIEVGMDFWDVSYLSNGQLCYFYMPKEPAQESEGFFGGLISKILSIF